MPRKTLPTPPELICIAVEFDDDGTIRATALRDLDLHLERGGYALYAGATKVYRGPERTVLEQTSWHLSLATKRDKRRITAAGCHIDALRARAAAQILPFPSLVAAPEGFRAPPAPPLRLDDECNVWDSRPNSEGWSFGSSSLGPSFPATDPSQPLLADAGSEQGTTPKSGDAGEAVTSVTRIIADRLVVSGVLSMRAHARFFQTLHVESRGDKR